VPVVALVVAAAPGAVSVDLGVVSVEGMLDGDLLGAPAAARPLAPLVMVSLRTFLCFWNAMMCSLGPNRQIRATVALRVTDRQSVVS